MAETHQVSIRNMKFEPADVQIAKGDTVEWQNKDAMSHTVTADNDAFNSGQIMKDKSFSRVFDQAGTFGYFCEIHPEMTGTVRVS